MYWYADYKDILPEHYNEVSYGNNFVVSALKSALEKSVPKIANSDQGSQFTGKAYTSMLLNSNIAISMDGRNRALDNIFTERLWRTVKYENVYIHSKFPLNYSMLYAKNLDISRKTCRSIVENS